MIAVMLLTYRRTEYARRALESLRLNLITKDDVWLHIADDGSDQAHRDVLLKDARAIWGDNVSVSNSERRGYGGSYNLATQKVHRIADLILPLEDDWVLTQKFDLDAVAAVLRDGTFGCVRMGYIGSTQDLRGTFRNVNGKWWMELDPDSPEPHVFAGHPRLETVEWEKKVGEWPENWSAGETEFEVAHYPAARKGVAWPIDLIKPHGDVFVHIGTERA